MHALTTAWQSVKSLRLPSLAQLQQGISSFQGMIATSQMGELLAQGRTLAETALAHKRVIAAAMTASVGGLWSAKNVYQFREKPKLAAEAHAAKGRLDTVRADLQNGTVVKTDNADGSSTYSINVDAAAALRRLSELEKAAVAPEGGQPGTPAGELRQFHAQTDFSVAAFRRWGLSKAADRVFNSLEELRALATEKTQQHAHQLHELKQQFVGVVKPLVDELQKAGQGEDEAAHRARELAHSLTKSVVGYVDHSGRHPRIDSDKHPLQALDTGEKVSNRILEVRTLLGQRQATPEEVKRELSRIKGLMPAFNSQIDEFVATSNFRGVAYSASLDVYAAEKKGRGVIGRFVVELFHSPQVRELLTVHGDEEESPLTHAKKALIRLCGQLGGDKIDGLEGNAINDGLKELRDVMVALDRMGGEEDARFTDLVKRANTYLEALELKRAEVLKIQAGQLEQTLHELVRQTAGAISSCGPLKPGLEALEVIRDGAQIRGEEFMQKLGVFFNDVRLRGRQLDHELDRLIGAADMRDAADAQLAALIAGQADLGDKLSAVQQRAQRVDDVRELSSRLQLNAAKEPAYSDHGQFQFVEDHRAAQVAQKVSTTLESASNELQGIAVAAQTRRQTLEQSAYKLRLWAPATFGILGGALIFGMPYAMPHLNVAYSRVLEMASSLRSRYFQNLKSPV